MDTKEVYLEKYHKKYHELFQKHNAEYLKKIELTEGKKALNKMQVVMSKHYDHVEYFALEKAWEAFKKQLDVPIINNSKYQVGDRIRGLHKKWAPAGSDLIGLENIMKEQEIEGTIIQKHVNACGDGKLYYDLENVVPDCWESNPTINEDDIQHVLSEYNK